MKLDWRRAALFVTLLASLAYHGARAYLSLSALLDPSVPPAAPGANGLLVAVLLEVLLPVFFLAVGFWVVWRKPEDTAAWLLLYMMLAFSSMAGSQTADLERLGPVWGAAAAVWFTFFSTSWPLAMLSFAVVFPEPLPLDTRRPWLKWLLLIPLFAVSVIQAGTSLVIAGLSLGTWFQSLASQLGQTGLFLRYMAMGLFFATLGFKSGTSRNPDSVRRLRILFIAAGVAMAPALVLATVALVTGTSFGARASDSVIVPTVLVMMIFPLVLAYVVIVHKAMGVGMAIRQGLQYALAQRAVRFIQMAVAIAVLFGLLEIFSDPDKRQVDRVRSLGLGVLFLVFFQRGAIRFRAWIDRRFFREAVDAEHILADLGEHVRSITDRRDLLETVSRKIGEALHVPRVAAFVRGESGFMPAFATGYGGDAVALEFGNASVLTCCVSALEKPQTIYLDDKRSWIVREKIPEADARKLRDLQSEVLIPLRTKTAVEGFLSLGPKSSEAAYSPSDLQLLQSVAHQTALALDNSRLVEQVAGEVAKRERMTREIEIAREVQFTLLPQTASGHPGTRPRGPLPPRRGDRRRLLRFHTPRGRTGDRSRHRRHRGEGHSRRPPHGRTPGGPARAGPRGQPRPRPIDDQHQQAGVRVVAREPLRHLLLRRVQKRRLRVRERRAQRSGPPAQGRDHREAGGGGTGDRAHGLRALHGRHHRHPRGRRAPRLHRRDLGVHEPRRGGVGEDRLIPVLRTGRDLAARDLVHRIMTEADAFAAGAKQHDDMTLIVMKVA